MASRTTVLAGLCFMLMSNTLLALIVRLSDLETMASLSDIVIHGYIGDQTVTTDDLGRLITLTQLEVVDGIYGAKTGDVVTVYQVGGQKDGLVMPLLGGQQYRVGQELLLFGLSLDGSYVSFGGGQGKFDVLFENGQEIVKEDLGDVLAINPGSHDAVSPAPLVYTDKNTIKDEIKEMIKFRRVR